MKLRIASIAFLLGSVATGMTWLSAQPVLASLASAVRRTLPEGSPERELLKRLWTALPALFALDIALLTFVCYVVLYSTVGRPLRQTERTVEQLERLDLAAPFASTGGPMLSRLQTSLRRMADALRGERELTQRQLAELKRVNEQLFRAQAGLIAAERLATVGRLAAGVAHEVGNPLAGILGYLSLSRGLAQSSPELLEYLDRLEQEVGRIDRIVRGLLDLGRPARAELVPVEVRRITETCVELLAKGADFEEVEVELRIDPDVVARADPGSLSQVVINLLLNAAQAMGGKGRIVLAGRREGEQVTLDVEDSGPGIPADVLPRLFEPFFTTKLAGKGTGLGLAVSLHLVNGMGGQLTAANAEGGGARLTVRLRAA